MKIIGFLITSFLLIASFNVAYSKEICDDAVNNNYTIDYSIKDDVLTYDIYQNEHKSFYYVDLLYHNYPTYLNLTIPNQKPNVKSISVPFFSYDKNEPCSLNINKLYDNYNSFNILYDSKKLNQIYMFPLTSLMNKKEYNPYYFVKTTHLKGQVNLKNWLNHLKPFFSQNIKGEQKVSLIFILIHDPYFKSETIIKIDTTLDFN